MDDFKGAPVDEVGHLIFEGPKTAGLYFDNFPVFIMDVADVGTQGDLYLSVGPRVEIF
jgi:hypothetical protein